MNRFLYLYLCLLLPAALGGCMTVNINHYGDGKITVNLEKPVSTSTLPVQANGNTVPVSAIP